MRASIDIGSNSTLLLAGTFIAGKFDICLNEARVTGLGKGLDQTGEFSKESMDSTFEALKDYKRLITSKGILLKDVKVTATEASRVAKNASTFYQRVKSELGFDTQTITGAGEAYYTALGVSLGTSADVESITVMDIGGASTELINIELKPFNIKSSISTPIGAVRATDWIELGEYEQRISKIINEYDLSSYKTKKLVCVAGTMTSIGAMSKKIKTYDDGIVQGSSLSREEFIQFKDDVLSKNQEQINTDYPFLGKRAKNIQGGVKAAFSLIEELDVEQIEISTFGLRYGTLSVEEINSKYLS